MPSSEDIHYLYARSYFPQLPTGSRRRMHGSAIDHPNGCSGYWLSYGLQEQAMIALALHRMVDERSSRSCIITSLAQRATVSEELGMYWKGHRRGLRLERASPPRPHALMIEAFQQVARGHGEA